MFSFVARTYDGQTVDLKDLVSFSYRRQRFNACDLLEAVFLFSNQDKKFTEVEFNYDNKILFSGIVEKQNAYMSSGGNFLKLNCKNRVALMMDNEVEPSTIFQKTAQNMYDLYAKPFGIKGTRFSSNPSINYLVIEKGRSCFDVINLFCRQMFEKPVLLTLDGYLTTQVLTGNTVYISNNVSGYNSFCFASLSYDRSKMVSKVYLKTDYENGNIYDIVLQNAYATNEKIVRERYLHPTDEWFRNISQYGYDLLESSRRDASCLEVWIPNIIKADVGDKILFIDQMGSYNNFYIVDLKVSLGKQGFITKIKAWDQKYI
ncbi:MAG: hypothetical protein K0R90_566 [Oscillospiraceae bacterium]|nr:hypothetical protein [Oscillospiraceae bacterium]